MIITIKHFFITGSIIFLTAFLGCVRLPDYARPRTGVQLTDGTKAEDAFTYRKLTRADFKAAALPPDRAMHATSINAYTCARIQLSPDTKVVVNRARYGESVIHIGSIRQIAFEAVMLPGCSWWNPALPAKNNAYVLQHEQIHFAIVELTARQLTTSAQEQLRTFLAIQPTHQAAMDEVMATIKQMIRSATDESLKWHTAFDEDTSLFHSPKWQRRWLKKIEGELVRYQGTD